ncbi:hypothetical protein D3C72_1107640 [compost metagenome]
MLAFAQEPLGQPHGLRRIGRHATRQRARGRQQFHARHHARHQAPFQRGGRADGVTGERHFGGARHADQARQEPGAAVTGDDAQLDEAFRKRGGFRRDAHVAHAGQVAARADGRPVHRRNRRHLQRMQRQRQALYALPVFLAQFHATHLGADLPLHLVDVAA